MFSQLQDLKKKKARKHLEELETMNIDVSLALEKDM